MDTAFRGKGSVKTSGRWHHKGTQVAYASEHSGVAVLEELVWLGNYEVARKSSYVLLSLHFNPDEHLETLDESDLPDDWDPFPHPEATRALGPSGTERNGQPSSPSRVHSWEYSCCGQHDRWPSLRSQRRTPGRQELPDQSVPPRRPRAGAGGAGPILLEHPPLPADATRWGGR